MPSAPALLDLLGKEVRARARPRAAARWTSPMLAVLVDEHFSDPDWIFERKLDGVRCLVARDDGEVRIRSRNDKDLRGGYPELVEAFERERRSDFVVDGEIVAFEGKATSFARLQRRLGIRDPRRARATGVAVKLYLFDLIHVEGHDLTRVPLVDRKRLLKAAFAWKDPLRYTPHRRERGEAFLAQACRQGWEGLIAKRAASPYASRRSKDWLKFKCVNRQELVVGGWTEPRGARVALGALLMGYHEDGRLRYAGKVGTGFDERTLRDLHARLVRLERRSSPFADPVDEKGAHFATPRLVAEVAFTEWTPGGRLRHPRYIGLRVDKPATDVVRESVRDVR